MSYRQRQGSGVSPVTASSASFSLTLLLPVSHAEDDPQTLYPWALRTSQVWVTSGMAKLVSQVGVMPQVSGACGLRVGTGQVGLCSSSPPSSLRTLQMGYMRTRQPVVTGSQCTSRTQRVLERMGC